MGDDGLTNRQRAFVEAYLGPARLNATAAAEAAGYSKLSKKALQVQGSRLLSNAIVQSRVRARLAGFGLDRETILQRIGLLGGASMADMLDADRRGNYGLSLKKAAEAGALGNIRSYVEQVGEGGITRRIELHDPYRYLELLAKHLGLVGGEPGAGGDGAGDVGKMTVEQVIALHKELGVVVPTNLLPAAPAVGSGLVDEKGQPQIRTSIEQEQQQQLTPTKGEKPAAPPATPDPSKHRLEGSGSPQTLPKE